MNSSSNAQQPKRDAYGFIPPSNYQIRSSHTKVTPNLKALVAERGPMDKRPQDARPPDKHGFIPPSLPPQNKSSNHPHPVDEHGFIPPQNKSSHSEISPEMRAQIAERKAKALEQKQQREREEERRVKSKSLDQPPKQMQPKQPLVVERIKSTTQPPALIQPQQTRPTSFPTSFPAFPVLKPQQKIAPPPPPKKLSVKVSFTVRDANYFQANPEPLHMLISDTIRGLPSQERHYSSMDKVWLVAFSSYETLKKMLQGLKQINVIISEIPAGVKKLFMNGASKNVDESAATLFLEGKEVGGIPDQLLRVLYPYQRQGVAFGIKNHGRVLIADEMGLGKSIQALALALYFQKEWPLLIVCPSSVKPAWKNILQFSDISGQYISLIEKGSDKLPTNRNTSTVIIMSYEMMTSRKAELSELDIYVVILDESHSLKTESSKRTKASKELAKKADRVILLSGTPALSRPSELYSQIKMLNTTLFGTFREFGMRYGAGHDTRFGFKADGATNTDELETILKSGIMLRRLKEDVMGELPEKHREVIYLTGDKIDRKMAEVIKARQELNQLDEKAAVAVTQREKIMRYYQMTAEVKAECVSEHIVNTYLYEGSPPRKILIFGHHKIMLDTIAQLLDAKGVKYIRIDGQAKKREELCKRFQEKKEVMVAILGIQSAGVGITLTAADTVVFAELSWTPASMLQAEDRAHRIGQKNPVKVQYMLARNTADDDIWPMLNRKLNVLGSVNLSADSYRGSKSIKFDLSNRLITDYLVGLEVEEAAKDQEGKEGEDDVIVIEEDKDSGGDDDATPPKRSKY